MHEDFDIVVIGGGPAGMKAAGDAAARGARVVILEKNPGLGKKLLITGGGRCNVTNAELDTKKLLAKYREGGKYLSSPFSKWSVRETLDYFHSRGMPTKIEAEQRVFPVSNKAVSVWEVLVGELKKHKVEISPNAQVTSIQTESNRIVSVTLKGGQTIAAKACILATGGKSRPETGSTGDGFRWLAKLEHKVNEARASLVPIEVKEKWVARVAGVAFAHAKISLYQNEVKQLSALGKVLFTHAGLSGPGILNVSADIGELLKYGEVIVELDLQPKSGYEKVNADLQKCFKEHSNKMIKNSLGAIVPPAVVPVILEIADIKADTFCNSVTRDARIRLMKTLKHLRLEVKGLMGLDKAVVSSGGIDLSEVDFQTMRSRRYENLYIIGDLLDIDRPSGGYSLQMCWTTAAVAAEAAVVALSTSINAPLNL